MGAPERKKPLTPAVKGKDGPGGGGDGGLLVFFLYARLLAPVPPWGMAASSLFSCPRDFLPGRKKRSIMTVNGTAQGAHQTGNKERS